MDLSNYVLPTAKAWFEYPGLDGFEVEICYLSREELLDMRNKCTLTKFKRGEKVEELDSDLFQNKYIESVITNWKGLTLESLQKLIPIKVPEGEDPDTEVEFSKDNARILMKNSRVFDNWISDQLEEVQNFTQRN